MILIGQYDSPFVRRVAIALQTYGQAYEHRPWSTFGDAERLAAFNPLRRVPTLVLDDGVCLIESFAILDFLDELAGPAAAMIAASGPARRETLRLCALATGLCDKLVALVYERVLHAAVSDDWVARCQTQIRAVLDVLESERARADGPFWGGERPSHADVAAACAMRFLGEAHPSLAAAGDWPALAALAARCEALPAFAAVVQPFLAPGSA
ncbi:glutathione S-transferase family protein [Caulobacter sp. KR2-114]|uniref:glutathione S-transferase family protein n=1 Tax=Caulobacter sp. KR2-114 TaxID=3400912 RepID=UPI003C0FC493